MLREDSDCPTGPCADDECFFCYNDYLHPEHDDTPTFECTAGVLKNQQSEHLTINIFSSSFLLFLSNVFRLCNKYVYS